MEQLSFKFVEEQTAIDVMVDILAREFNALFERTLVSNLLYGNSLYVDRVPEREVITGSFRLARPVDTVILPTRNRCIDFDVTS